MACTTELLLPNTVLDTGFCAIESPMTLSQPRSVVYNKESNSHLTLDRGVASVLLLQD